MEGRIRGLIRGSCFESWSLSHEFWDDRKVEKALEKLKFSPSSLGSSTQ